MFCVQMLDMSAYCLLMGLSGWPHLRFCMLKAVKCLWQTTTLLTLTLRRNAVDMHWLRNVRSSSWSQKCLGGHYYVTQSYLTNLSFKVNVFPGLFVKLVTICQQSEDIVSSVTEGPEEIVTHVFIFFLHLKWAETNIRESSIQSSYEYTVAVVQLEELTTPQFLWQYFLTEELNWSRSDVPFSPRILAV